MEHQLLEQMDINLRDRLGDFREYWSTGSNQPDRQLVRQCMDRMRQDLVAVVRMLQQAEVEE